MEAMFSSASSFNQNIGDWNTSKVSNMKFMFYNATSFDQDICTWDISNTSEMPNMFTGVTIQTPHYDALLVAWENQDVQNDVQFSAGLSQYSSVAATQARARLISDHGWIITDGGQGT